MEDHGAIGEFDKRFGEGKSLVAVRAPELSMPLSLSFEPALGPINSEKEARTKGRSRVPKPPTRMSAVDSN